MTRKLLVIVILTIALIQRVSILQMADTGDGTFFLIALQIIFVGVILYLRSNDKLYENMKIRYIALASYIIIYVGLYYLFMYPFFRIESFDMIFVTLSVVLLANYELMFFKGYEEYSVDWKRRLIIVLPVALFLFLVVNKYINSYFLNHPSYFYDYVQYQEGYYQAFRNIGENYTTAAFNIIIYTVYKLDAVISIIPKTPTTTDFWLKFNPAKNYME